MIEMLTAGIVTALAVGVIYFILIIFVAHPREALSPHHPDVPLRIPQPHDAMVDELVALGPLVITSVKRHHLHSPFSGEVLGSVYYEVEVTRFISTAAGTPMTGQSKVKFIITGPNGRFAQLEKVT
jgi:hypothetical protein